MKIADPETIRAGEQDLIDTIREKVDLQVIEDVVARQVSLKDLEFTEGDIVIHEGEVAYRLDFTVHMGVSILFDREGNLLAGGTVDHEGQEVPEEGEEPMAADVPSEDDLIIEIASQDDLLNEIASMDDVDPVDSEPAPVSEIEALLSKNRGYWADKVDECKGGEPE